MPYCHPSVLAVQARLMWRNDPTSSSLRLVCLQIEFVQLSSRSIKLCRSGVQTRALSQVPALQAGHLQSHAEPEMLTIIIFSSLPLFLLCQETSFDEVLLLQPDLLEDEFTPRQTNSTAAATTTSLAFGAAAVLLVTSKKGHIIQYSF